MSEQETAVQQPLLKQFPTQVNRENILRIRELFRKNREFSRRFVVSTSEVVSHGFESFAHRLDDPCLTFYASVAS